MSNTNKEGETTLSPTLVFANERGSISLSGRYQLDKAILSSVSAEVVSEYPKNVYWGTKVTVDSERLVKTKHTAEVVEGNSKVNFSVYVASRDDLSYVILERGTKIFTPLDSLGSMPFLIL